MQKLLVYNYDENIIKKRKFQFWRTPIISKFELGILLPKLFVNEILIICISFGILIRMNTTNKKNTNVIIQTQNENHNEYKYTYHTYWNEYNLRKDARF